MYSMTNARREQAATPTPSVNNIESISFEDEDNPSETSVQLGYHYEGTVEEIQEEQRKNSWYEGMTAMTDRLFGGGQGRPSSDSSNDRKEDGREDGKSVASARSNASTKSAKSAKSARSNKSARTYKSAWSNTGAGWLAGFGHASPKSSGSRKSPGMSSARSSKSARDEEGQFVSAEAYGPNSEAGDEDVENIPIDETVDTYTQKSKDVVAGRSTKKRRALVGLSLVVGVVAGASLGVVVENRKELANAEVAEADYLANSKGMYFYDDECLPLPPQRRARNIDEDEETPFVDMKRSDEVVEAAPVKASGVQRREDIIIGPAPGGKSARPEYYRKCTKKDSIYGNKGGISNTTAEEVEDTELATPVESTEAKSVEKGKEGEKVKKSEKGKKGKKGKNTETLATPVDDVPEIDSVESETTGEASGAKLAEIDKQDREDAVESKTTGGSLGAKSPKGPK